MVKQSAVRSIMEAWYERNTIETYLPDVKPTYLPRRSQLKWYFHSAGFVKTLTPRLVGSLVKRSDVVKHYIEWCETPEERTPGFV